MQYAKFSKMSLQTLSISINSYFTQVLFVMGVIHANTRNDLSFSETYITLIFTGFACRRVIGLNEKVL